ncbi:MAG: tetratricopeptide repeat protein [Archangium sp.]
MTHALLVALLLSAPAAKTPKAAPKPAAAVEDENTKKARELFSWGQKLYKQARYAEAISKFEEAYAVRPHPVIYFNIGKCYEQMGDTAKALRNYRDYLRLSPDASDKETVSDAVANLERRLREKGVQQLMVFAEPADARISVDGKDLGTSPATVELVAGNHQLSVSADGFQKVDRSFVMQLSRAMEITIALRPVGEAPVASDAPRKEDKPTLDPGTPPPAPPLVAQAAPEQKKGKPGTFIAGGVAVAALGAGIGMGVASSINNQQLLNQAPGPDKNVQQLHDASRDFAIGADVAYGVAAAAAITAVVLFFVEK